MEIAILVAVAVFCFLLFCCAATDAVRQKDALGEANRRLAEVQSTERELRNEIVSQGMLIADLKSWLAQTQDRSDGFLTTIEAIENLIKKSREKTKCDS